MTCALRALTLCDGQVLEDPSRALAECLCRQLDRVDGSMAPHIGDELRAQRQRLIEATMAAPPLPLGG
jgi:hypothetical protein